MTLGFGIMLFIVGFLILGGTMRLRAMPWLYSQTRISTAQIITGLLLAAAAIGAGIYFIWF
ncbi:MAG: hypothetical protein IBX36_05215 [Dehalococcoidia bacterium]|nr:hypothetical protein [Dehalococcoidia bacterium]